ncbi:DNA polymerase-3 subunit alpha [Clostridium cavendishii DSM 21758]|uniref:DNA polymerase III PolC-type n=1 Tax=Clostridium cavendishii DSM 21758 TaxID=1121302 RepID=A0A1M6HK64_9CLOT|nr:DNA polymerase III subunit alpha [Clostridium cavendishii]SHJ22561.1 DNA polymerase-3 subunit alpha [Clostridium cavendishii DSM 21758]
MKRINEIFSDYEAKGNINNAIVESVILYKKSQCLELKITSDKYVEIKEVESLNMFIRRKFSLKDSIIKVKYVDGIERKPIEEELENIILLIADKQPVLKSVVGNSDFTVTDNTINFSFKIAISNFLKSMKYDKQIHNAIKTFYGESYKINFIDNVSSEELELQQEEKQKEMLAVLSQIKTDAISNSPKLPKEPVVRKEDEKEETGSKKADPFLILGRSSKIKDPIIKITDITPDEGKVVIEGELSNMETRELRSGKILVSFDVYDGSSSMTCKSFLNPAESEEVLSRLKKAGGVRLVGMASYSKFSGEVEMIANIIIETMGIRRVKRQDNAEVKRVELHMHTQMSQMDAMTSATDLIKRAMSWGMKSIAITDHGVVQAFPEAHKLLGRNNPDMKVIYGVEAYLAPDKKPSFTNSKGQSIDTTYCVLDLETTGFSPKTEKITEIGIMKYKDGKVIDKFSCFVNPEKPIPARVIEVTNITDDMVKDAEKIEQVFPKMLEFIEGSVLVAHNATFDVGFLKHNARVLGYDFDFTSLDTLTLAQELFPEYKSYKLGRIAKNLGIKVEVAHRALDDVDTTVKVFEIMLGMLKERGVKTIDDIELYAANEESKKESYKKLRTYHTIIFAKNYVGLKNLYRLVSYSSLDYFYKKPRILRSMLHKYSEGLIIGSACSEGELYQSILLGKSDEEIEAIAQEYDYLEIQPLGNNEYLVRKEQVPDREYLKEINKKIIKLGEKLNKPVVATGDVHFMDPEDEIYRRILEAGQGFKDADEQAPLYLRTTEEMLAEFSYLGREKAYEVVVTNTNKIADMCEQISPISPDKATPHIDGCEQTIKDITYEKAHELYGDPLPELVKQRLEKELDSIIKNGFSVMYIIAQKLVWKSNEDGYLVGSRGSVGSSVVAYMTGITEVNALPPHYRCPNCKHSDFSDYGIKLGFDLPDKKCPVCGEELAKDGIDIPFETFLGFNGDKEPDIDLNFSGEYQAKAHRYTEVIFGKGTTFKAGTIGTIAEKTAFGYVNKYFEEKNITVNKAEILRISKGCTGIKRTSGQHPGGIIVVPKGREIFEFCPVQHPADDPNSDIITTHFDYHSIDQNLLKLDILGHDDPTVIRMLQDITGIDPKTIPMDEKKTMSIFSSTEALGVTPEQINSKVGTFGIPEFGTKFVRGMLLDTMPKAFMDLICISGLSHGTDVWLGNAKDLIDQGIVTSISEAVCTRDDIMVYLIKKGLPPNTAFKIMETVRKGKALKDPKFPEYEELMREYDVPEWYIDSCKKIKYMFPKAHAAAYVMMAFRIAWFKVHIPQAYYAAYFSIRAKAFDAEFMIFGKEKVRAKMKEIEMMGMQAPPKDKDMYDDLELVLEMYERGLKFLPIDLYKSHSTNFLVEEDGLRPPINSIAGMGNVAAEGIYNAVREETPINSVEDLKKRAKIGNAAAELLKKFGCLNGLPEKDQLSFFDVI